MYCLKYEHFSPDFRQLLCPNTKFRFQTSSFISLNPFSVLAESKSTDLVCHICMLVISRNRFEHVRTKITTDFFWKFILLGATPHSDRADILHNLEMHLFLQKKLNNICVL